MRRTISCDQVVWLQNALERYINVHEKPAVSRKESMKIYACMYEIIEVLNLRFEDERARFNATPPDVRDNTENCEPKVDSSRGMPDVGLRNKNMPNL